MIRFSFIEQKEFKQAKQESVLVHCRGKPPAAAEETCSCGNESCMKYLSYWTSQIKMSNCHLEFCPACGVDDPSLDPDYFIRAKSSCFFILVALKHGAGS